MNERFAEPIGVRRPHETKDLESQEGSVSELSKREAVVRQAQIKLEHICAGSGDPHEWTERLMQSLEPIVRHLDSNIFPESEKEKVLAALGRCSGLGGKEEFIHEVMTVLDPIFDLKVTHAPQLEEAQASAMVESSGFTPLNRLVSYGRKGSIVHLHHAAGTTVPNKRSLYLDGMKKLATIVYHDPEIEEITATSWIVGKNPGIFSRAGFIIEEVPEDVRREHFAGEERELKSATISRKEFLERFYEPSQDGE